MKPAYTPRHLDVHAFAMAGGRLDGQLALSSLARVMVECAPAQDTPAVRWSARGETRLGGKGEQQLWLHLDADCSVPLICQRCLDVVHARLLVDRWFRFVPDEATALAQDETCEEDLLAVNGEFDLEALIEDELVLELPHIARHDVCPAQRNGPVSGSGSVAEPAHPFAVLAGLKRR